MDANFTLCLGTLSSGIYHSRDGAGSWTQARLDMPVPPWSPWIEVRALAVSPHEPGVVLAGSNAGLHRSRDGGATWEFLHSPADGMQVWAVAFHPKNPNRLYAGLAPFETEIALVRSTDGGATWTATPMPFEGRTKFGASHVTSFAFDLDDPEILYASVEVSGLYMSRDGGITWAETPPFGEGTNRDVHFILTLPGGRRLAATPDGVWSSDHQEPFSLHRFEAFPEREPLGVQFNITGYSRGLAVKPDDPDVVLLGTGDYTPGRFGAIERSTDGGRTWTKAALSDAPNSHFYSVAFHPTRPNLALAVTIYGYVYLSDDAGLTWTKSKREFGEVRSAVIVGD